MNDEERERLSDSLEAKVKTQKCPFCETELWFLLDKKDLTTGLLLSNGQYVSVYTLACTNCGFVRQHLRQVLES